MHVRVDRIDAGGANAHDDFARARFRIGNFFELEDVGTAELMNSDRSHSLSRSPERLAPRGLPAALA